MSNFDFSVPKEQEILAEVKAEALVETKEQKELREAAERNVANIMAVDLDNLSMRHDLLGSIEGYGVDTMRQSSNQNTLIQASIGTLSKSGDEGSLVAQGLVDLSDQIKSLDPSVINFSNNSFLGKLFNPLKAYFKRFEKADSVIAGIVDSLEKGKTTLKNDNTTLSIEQKTLRDTTKVLASKIEMAALMDASIEHQIEQARLRGEDPEKIRFITEEVLFPLRQRVMDMQQMMAVNQQGVVAMEVLIRNNKELIRGVERANTVTVSALRTAVTVASALYNQNIVLQKIEALNQTTNALIQGTARALKTQGAAIHKQALDSAVSVDALKQSFTDVLDALESISTFKQEALPKMKETIQGFRELALEGESHIKRLESGNKVNDTKALQG